jgi:hypothetical protein
MSQWRARVRGYADHVTTSWPLPKAPEEALWVRGGGVGRVRRLSASPPLRASGCAAADCRWEIGIFADLFDNLVGTGDLRNTSMASAALGEFHGVAVGVMCAHRSFPWLFMRRLEKLNASCFQKLEQLIEMIRGQFNMNTGPLFRSHSARFRIRGIHG